MIRTQVYLPRILYHHIKMIAARNKKAAAEVIRELLEEGVKKRHGNAGEALLRIAKNPIKGLPKNLSTNIDKYLYED